MTKLNDLIAQASRGEPVLVGAVIAAILGALGVELTDGAAQNLVTAVATIAAAFMARRYSTPYANPVVPTRTVAGEPVPQTKPVITLSGKREA